MVPSTVDVLNNQTLSKRHQYQHPPVTPITKLERVDQSVRVSSTPPIPPLQSWGATSQDFSDGLIIKYIRGVLPLRLNSVVGVKGFSSCFGKHVPKHFNFASGVNGVKKLSS